MAHKLRTHGKLTCRSGFQPRPLRIAAGSRYESPCFSRSQYSIKANRSTAAFEELIDH
jgi:hypothetical protein